MLKIRLSWDRLIFDMGIPYLGKTVFILRRGPGGQHRYAGSMKYVVMQTHTVLIVKKMIDSHIEKGVSKQFGRMFLAYIIQ